MSKTVMVVDDHSSFGDMLGMMLKVLGHRPEVFSSPSTCLEWLQREAPDIALVDIRMPGIDGVTLLEHIRAQGHGFPVVAITGYPADDLTKEARDAGALAVASKPLSIDMLESLVRLA